MTRPAAPTLACLFLLLAACSGEPAEAARFEVARVNGIQLRIPESDVLTPDVEIVEYGTRGGGDDAEIRLFGVPVRAKRTSWGRYQLSGGEDSIKPLLVERFSPLLADPKYAALADFVHLDPASAVTLSLEFDKSGLIVAAVLDYRLTVDRARLESAELVGAKTLLDAVGAAGDTIDVSFYGASVEAPAGSLDKLLEGVPTTAACARARSLADDRGFTLCLVAEC